MTDLDFLVEETVIPLVESLLYKLGYRQQSHRPREFYNTHHHRMPFVHPQRGIWVEVHRGLFPSGTKLATTRVFSHPHLTRQLRPSAFQGRPVTRLSDALQIVYIAAHWAFEFKGIGGMLAMLDLIYLLKQTKEAIDWEAMFDWLDGSIAATHLYLMLTYLARYGLIDIPPERLHDLALRQRSFGPLNLHIMHKLVDRYMIDRPPSGRQPRTCHQHTHHAALLTRANTASRMTSAWQGSGAHQHSKVSCPSRRYLATNRSSSCRTAPPCLHCALNHRR
jgi:hypothetical protein